LPSRILAYTFEGFAFSIFFFSGNHLNAADVRGSIAGKIPDPFVM